jgi:hypothetical protein
MPVVNLFRLKKTTPRLERLHTLSLFVNLTPAELQIVDGLLHERDYLEGEVIFDEGEEGQAIYIVASGEVLICRPGHADAANSKAAAPGASHPRDARATAGASPNSAPAPFSANWRCSTIRRARRRRVPRSLQADRVLPRRFRQPARHPRPHRLEDLARTGAPPRRAHAHHGARDGAPAKHVVTMTGERLASARAHPPRLRTRGLGLAIIAATCLLLLVFQKVLWLVVPFLLALILYYFLYPPVQALIYRGMSRDAAASVVTLAFWCCCLLSAVVSLMPRLTSLARLAGYVDRYVQGRHAVARPLACALENATGRPWPTPKLADTVAARLTEARGQHQRPSGTGGAGHHGLDAVADAGALPGLLLPARRPPLQALSRRCRAQCLLSRRRCSCCTRSTARRAPTFQGLINLTILDTVTLALGLVAAGHSRAADAGPDLRRAGLGALRRFHPRRPAGGAGGRDRLSRLDPAMAYWAIGLFGLVRLLDDFLYMPMTIGKSLELHPLVTVLMIFVGGAVAGVSGLMLVLPVLGVVMVIGETIGVIVTDPRLMARHRHARNLALRRPLGAGQQRPLSARAGSSGLFSAPASARLRMCRARSVSALSSPFAAGLRRDRFGHGLRMHSIHCSASSLAMANGRWRARRRGWPYFST